uniref:Uncharacterized protein n=1 Tax=viral metagenome TaxID=1070528 RepID=A0A6C0KB39_9ZZZZ
MSEPEYVMLNPVCSVIDDRNVWRRTQEPYVDFNHHIRWRTEFYPVKCYLKDIDITNIKDYALDKFLK